ncbi:hypothetical protein Acr_15g0008770 [Actinidia rufa]|uniref:Uncharacterized protein n=1 Tax=Actinidia rufa TaxID=165716 RepID=A0A7J0FU89_9ERIC|nr:hypothetical protein Acr_15g0008770 [Actinidia rufa]
MVILDNTMGWLSEIGSRVSNNVKRSSAANANNNRIGILSFETAKTMSRLLSVYKSLSDPEISKLRNETVKSEGVVYLNSNDENFLLRLACSERVEDLDKVAITVARLGMKCSDFGLNRFDLVYTDLKLGIIDLGKLEYGSRENREAGREDGEIDFGHVSALLGLGIALRNGDFGTKTEAVEVEYQGVSIAIGEFRPLQPENIASEKTGSPLQRDFAVESDLSKNVRETPEEEEDGGGLAEGWREAMGEILRWLTPVARDTVRWQAERNFEKMRFESRPAALLVQTLHFSDREKVEAAVADVFGGAELYLSVRESPE